MLCSPNRYCQILIPVTQVSQKVISRRQICCILRFHPEFRIIDAKIIISLAEGKLVLHSLIALTKYICIICFSEDDSRLKSLTLHIEHLMKESREKRKCLDHEMLETLIAQVIRS